MAKDGLAEALAFLNGPEDGAGAPRLRSQRSRRRGAGRAWLVTLFFVALHAAMILAFLNYTGLVPVRGLEGLRRGPSEPPMPTGRVAGRPSPSPGPMSAARAPIRSVAAPGPQASVASGRRSPDAPPHASPATAPRPAAADAAPRSFLGLVPAPGFEADDGAGVGR